MVTNVHQRVVDAPIEVVGPLLDRLGGPDDVLWPSPDWPPMRLDRPLAAGAVGRHISVRYHVHEHVPGRRVGFTFAPGTGLTGTHTFTADPVDEGRTLVRHELTARLSGRMLPAWPLAVRWAHDALVEDLLDRAGRAAGAPPARPARHTPVARLMRRWLRPRVREVPPPRTALLATALPRVDWSDAFAVRRRPGTPDDPQAWADALFRDPPDWVLALMRAREALVGAVGIDRTGPRAFDTVATAPGEVLLGTDERHLDFRASVLVRPERVVLTSVVTLHNTRGRAYFALVRRVHPAVVRAMLARAAARVSRRPAAAVSASSRPGPTR